MNTPDPERLAALAVERGKVYGDPLHSHRNIGLSWTGLIQQHYGLTLPHPLPAALVAYMMTTFKVQRSVRVYHADNIDDGHVYLGFGGDFQQAEYPEPITISETGEKLVSIPLAEFERLKRCDTLLQTLDSQQHIP